jgi:hypothetical protein
MLARELGKNMKQLSQRRINERQHVQSENTNESYNYWQSEICQSNIFQRIEPEYCAREHEKSKYK